MDLKILHTRYRICHSAVTGLLAFLIIIPALVSCTSEREIDGPKTPEYGQVTISVAAPKPLSRALTDDQQDDISTMEVLVFDRTLSSNFVMMAATSVVNDIQIDNEPHKQFSVRLPMGTYDIILLANAKRWIGECFTTTDGIIPRGTPLTFQQVQEKLAATMAEGKGWNDDPASTGYVGLPMIGAANAVTILANEGNEIGVVGMTRTMARVDVELTGDAIDDFKLYSARIYNYHTTGYLFPGRYNASGVTLTPAPHDKPYRRTIPALEADKTKITGEIFLFEFDNQFKTPVTDVYEKRICLVVGGYYKDDTVVTYYRMDFRVDDPQNSGTWKYLDVERNTHFIFEITDVAESGWPDEEVAFRGVYRDLHYGVESWVPVPFPNTPL